MALFTVLHLRGFPLFRGKIYLRWGGEWWVGVDGNNKVRFRVGGAERAADGMAQPRTATVIVKEALGQERGDEDMKSRVAICLKYVFEVTSFVFYDKYSNSFYFTVGIYIQVITFVMINQVSGILEYLHVYFLRFRQRIPLFFFFLNLQNRENIMIFDQHYLCCYSSLPKAICAEK